MLNMHVACSIALHGIMLSLQSYSFCLIPVKHAVTPPNPKLCSHCSHAQIFTPRHVPPTCPRQHLQSDNVVLAAVTLKLYSWGVPPTPSGGRTKFWIAKHNFLAFVLAELHKGELDMVTHKNHQNLMKYTQNQS